MPSLLVQCQSQRVGHHHPVGNLNVSRRFRSMRVLHISVLRIRILMFPRGSEGVYCKMFYFSMRRNWNIFTFFLSDVLKVHLFGWECCWLVARSEEWHEKLQDGEDLVLFDVSSLRANYSISTNFSKPYQSFRVYAISPHMAHFPDDVNQT